MPNPKELLEVRQPKLLSYCSALYDKFTTDSTVEAGHIVWRGYVTKTAKEVGIPDGVYKRVMNQLHHMQCVEQLERGFRGKGSQTLILLLKPPTAEDWADERESVAEHLTNRRDPAILDRRIKDLEDRLKGVDIVRALAELQQQIDDLVNQFNAVHTTNNKES